eukprot:PhF_6_TR38677/c0_g1_i1/m.57865
MASHVLYAALYSVEEERRVRQPPQHRFTSPKNLYSVRFNQQRQVLNIAFNVGFPFMCSFAPKFLCSPLSAHLTAPVCLREALSEWKIALLKVAVQALLASRLVSRSDPLSRSVVYNWDLNLRLMEYYMRPILRAMHIEFMSPLFGSRPTDVDVSYLTNSSTPGVVAVEASLQRNGIIVLSDLIVLVVLETIGYQKKMSAPNAGPLVKEEVTKEHYFNLFYTLINDAVGYVAGALGAGVGAKVVPGGKGEYWGEMLGWFISRKVLGYTAKQKIRNSFGLK